MQATATPDRTKMYGLLHGADGTPLQRQVRILKVGIGVPSGKDIHVWIDANGQWAVEQGVYGSEGKREAKVTRFEQRAEAQAHYQQIRKTAAERKYPRKVPYFTFLRMAIDGAFVHDFDAIEQHGPVPNEIDVVFITNDPLDAAYQWWTAAEMKCEGDGITARRRIELAEGKDQKALAEAAKKGGERFFPIIDGCYTRGCQYPRGDRPVCKPHGRLFFQLLNSPRIGGTCTFDTTGFRSISQLFSCIREIKTLTGRGNPDSGTISGIPLKMLLRPYKVSHDGKPSVQYGVSLEFRASNAVEMARLLIGHAREYQTALRAAPAQIEAPAEEPGPTEYPQAADEAIEGAALDAEFYGGFEDAEEAEFSEADVPQTPQPRRASETGRAPEPETAFEIRDVKELPDCMEWPDNVHARYKGKLYRPNKDRTAWEAVP